MLKTKLLTLIFCLFCLSLSSSGLAKEKDWQRIYLASYPQSGNHWIRYLIEEASYIATSSVYRDPEPPKHMKQVFPWGGYCCDHGYKGICRYPTKKDIVLVKTHFPYPRKKSPFDELSCQLIIRIVRHPVDSFYSRYAKMPRGKLLEQVPSKRVKELIKSWRTFQTYWDKQKNVITIRYEDMLKDPAPALRIICDALEYDVTDEDIARAVSQNPPEGYELKHLNRFKPEDLKLIAEELSDLLAQYGYTIPL